MLTDTIRNCKPTTVTKDAVMQFGDHHDGTIQIPGLVTNGVIEISYFYGDNKPKNIIVISSQVGCPAKCSFCELGNEKFTRNLTSLELYDQVLLMLQQADQYQIDIDAAKHKVTIANTGEPLFNRDLVHGLERIAEDLEPSFKISTIVPSGGTKNFYDLALFASTYQQPVQVQISLISTSETYRSKAAGIKVASFNEIKQAADFWREKNPRGEKSI